MYNKSTNKSIIIVLIFVMTIIIPINSFATQENLFNKYGSLKEEDVLLYIQNSTDSEIVKFPDEYVTYYYGDNYTIVKDSLGYSRIDFKGNGRIFVNGKQVESRIIHNKVDKNEFNLFLLSTLVEEEWLPYGNTTYREYNVIGLAPGIVGGIIGGALGAKIGGLIGTIFSVVGGAVIGTFAGGVFSEYYISIIGQGYYKVPIITSRPEIKTVHEVYHGPKYNRYQNYWLSFTTL